MSSIADKVPNSDESSPRNNGDEANSVHGGGESLNHVISSALMQNIIHRWYYVPESFMHDFPQSFRPVPSINDSDRIWRLEKT